MNCLSVNSLALIKLLGWFKKWFKESIGEKENNVLASQITEAKQNILMKHLIYSTLYSTLLLTLSKLNCP